jgi:hypothetical protein
MGKLPIECNDGWLDIINKCHEELVAIDPEYVPIQIKEKFGGLRYYFTNGLSAEDAKSFHKMNAIVEKYEQLSFTICEICGIEGAKLAKRRNWLKTLCSEHEKEWKHGQAQIS